MIAKEVAMPKAGGSFRGLVTYLTSSRGTTERLGRIRLTNCVSSDVASAVLEVESAQARNRRARHGTYHLSRHWLLAKFTVMLGIGTKP